MDVIGKINAVEGLATYLVLATTLSFLIVNDYFRGSRAGRRQGYIPLCLVILMYLAGRAFVFTAGEAVTGGRLYPETVWGVLTFGSFLLGAAILARFPVLSPVPAGGTTWPGEQEDAGTPVRAILNKSLYFALAGAVVFLILSRTTVMPLTLAGLINTVLMAALAGPVVFLFQCVQASAQERKWNSYITLALATLSSLAVFTLLRLPGYGEFIKLSAMVLDVLTFIALLLLMRSHVLSLGLHYKKEADTSRAETEKARDELERISRIATDVYEDNNSLIKRQKEQTRSLTKRVHNLEKILQIGMTIQKRKDLNDLLQMIVELVRENLGFNTVLLRLFNEKTQSFETKAHVGVNEEVLDTILNYRMPLSEYNKLIKANYRISKSYFLRGRSSGGGHESGEGESVLVDNAWGDIDLLLVPLRGDGNRPAGYLSVESPENAKVSVAEVIETLEVIADLVVIAIGNARLFEELESKNDKLESYAAKLAGLNKMKANFVATISHEFRTPLTSIKAYCETLLRNADDVDRNILKEFLVVIDEESNRLMALIEDILDFSQMESGAIKFERTPCSLNEVVTIAAKELDKNFREKNITLHQELPATEVTIRAERELMKQLVVNLLHNASKFTPAGGNVWIKLEDETVTAKIVVTDDGIGIPEDQIDKIFDRFHQVDSSTTREHGGSGLGLAICRNIIEWHDGRIWVENQSQRGARFTAVLPKKHVIVRSEAVNRCEAIHRFEVERYLELLIEIVAELLRAKRVSIMSLDSSNQELRIQCALGLDEEVVEHARLKAGEGIAGRTLQDKSSYLVGNIEEDPRFNRRNNDFLYESKSFLSVPIKKAGEVIGIVNVTNLQNKEKFDEKDCKLLEIFAERVGIALGKLDELTRGSMAFAEVRNALKAILDVKRYSDEQHSDEITQLSLEVAAKMGLGSDEQSVLRYLLGVYDLGLSRVGYHIIKNPLQLSPADRQAVEQHALGGMEMLETVEDESRILDAILYHHENFDGTGYPARLSGDAIPLEARIIRVADSLRALMSHRPYQKRYSLEEAIEVLKHRSGTFFDPKIVAVFLDMLENKQSIFDEKKETVQIGSGNNQNNRT